ncbi:MAG: hypothetical protein M1840_008199 [Geoglossum simile]|nr:MAG: hypothetical protein M1840_008199 [Geoglossum simile]
MSSSAGALGSPIQAHAIPSTSGYQANSPTEGTGRNNVSRAKARKVAATGGGRAWTEEEEVYLLQTRLQKMPYKHIASHLKKTELACRLHYHQLSHGSNRRKRTGSPTVDSPIQSSSLSAQQPTLQGCDGGANAGTTTSTTTTTTSPLAHSPTTQCTGSPTDAEPASIKAGSVSPQRYCKPILPKPTCYISSPTTSHTRASPSSCCGSPRLLPRINCNSHAPPIDKDRLRRVYEAHRIDFWRFIADEYGGGVDPLLLEETWKRGFAYTPPTPCISPDNRTTSAVPTSASQPHPSRYTPNIQYPADSERDQRAFSSINQPLTPSQNAPIKLAKLSTSNMTCAPTTPPTASAALSTTSMPSMAALLTENSDPVKPKDIYPSSASSASPPAPRRVTSMKDIIMQDVGS